jgi:hypothetical protein
MKRRVERIGTPPQRRRNNRSLAPNGVVPGFEEHARAMRRGNLRRLEEESETRKRLEKALATIVDLESRTLLAMRSMGKALYSATRIRSTRDAFAQLRHRLAELSNPALGGNWSERMTPVQAWIGLEGQFVDDDELAAILYPGVSRTSALERIRQHRRQAKRRGHVALAKRKPDKDA